MGGTAVPCFQRRDGKGRKEEEGEMEEDEEDLTRLPLRE